MRVTTEDCGRNRDSLAGTPLRPVCLASTALARSGRLLIGVCAALLPLMGLAQERSATVEVGTYNIRYASSGDGEDVWPNRVDAVVKVIADHDIIGLQEVTPAQFEQLRGHLKQFDSYGVGRDDGKNKGESAAVFYRSDRFEVLDKGTFWLSEHPEQVGVKGWDAAFPRTCTWMHMRHSDSDKELLFANTHFDHRGARARAESGALIRKFVVDWAQRLPVLVVGDFNCLPDSEPYRALISQADGVSTALRDARSISQSPPAGPDGTWNGFREIIPGRIIDHIFVGPRIDVQAVETMNPKTDAGRFASDHLPVQALILLSGTKGDSESPQE